MKILLTYGKSATFNGEIRDCFFESSDSVNSEKLALLHPLNKNAGLDEDNW